MQAQGAVGRRQGLQVEVGTLWRMEREAHVARCALVWQPRSWELRVQIDGDALLAVRCRTHAEVVSVAERWRARLAQGGWAPASAAGKPIGVVGEERVDLQVVEKMGHLLADVLTGPRSGRAEGVRRHRQAEGVRPGRQRRIPQEQ
jgi:hypothetical protein